VAYDYDNYWVDSEIERKKYYENLYNHVKSFYKFKKDARVLDVAGGSGQLSNFFGLKNVTLIDISSSGLEHARKNYGFESYKCDLLNDSWPTRGKKYDYILCNEFLEHIYYPSIVLNEINKSLKKGGILYLGQPNMKPDGEHHLRRISYSYLQFILKENGFEIIDDIIVPRLILTRFKDIRADDKFILKIKKFIGAFVGSILSRKLKFYLARKMPNLLGQFYHIRVKKVN
jgi:2-polyprenyl-3-methyl-5-hydroxy-6-metoxy-1,4-benzoquinol methylase